MALDPDTMTFEDAYAELEDVVARLESGDLTLEESVTLYARGQALANRCGTLLDSAELRVQQLDDDGSLSPLEPV
jgi:exodeoxyribonuclease VII small subunit